MSASAARRRKQLAAKKAALAENATDPITSQLNSLLSCPEGETVDESTAYEALQLAQSQLRKSVKSALYEKATVTYGYDISMVLLARHGKASVASQLLTMMIQALVETHTVCDEVWIDRMEKLHQAYVTAIDNVSSNQGGGSEKKRLMRLHSKFLKKVLSWSDSLGTMRFGALQIHEMLGHHSWSLALLEQEQEQPPEADSSAQAQAQHQQANANASSKNNNNNNNAHDDDDEEASDWSILGLHSDAAQHFALAEQPHALLKYLQTLPEPTATETALNQPSPPCLRDALLTRAILAMVAVENIRDAHVLLQGYLDTCEKRDMDKLKKSYMSKTDGRAPSHVIFLSMLLSTCLKDTKTGPLYKWMLKGFQLELGRMHKPDILKAYTAKIGRVYFDIMPPPSMMSTLENVMAMAGGMGGGGPGAGINPAMMQAMMQGGGGF